MTQRGQCSVGTIANDMPIKQQYTYASDGAVLLDGMYALLVDTNDVKNLFVLHCCCITLSNSLVRGF